MYKLWIQNVRNKSKQKQIEDLLIDAKFILNNDYMANKDKWDKKNTTMDDFDLLDINTYLFHTSYTITTGTEDRLKQSIINFTRRFLLNSRDWESEVN